MLNKSKYRINFIRLLMFSVLAPLLAFYAGSFGMFLSDNLFSMATSGDQLQYNVTLPTSVLWYYASAGLGAVVLLVWVVDELTGFISKENG